MREELHGNGPIVRFGFGGRLLVLSTPVNKMTGTSLLQPGRARIYDYGGVLCDHANDYESLVLREAVELRSDAKSEAKTREKLAEVFERVAMFSHDNRRYGEWNLWRSRTRKSASLVSPLAVSPALFRSRPKFLVKPRAYFLLPSFFLSLLHFVLSVAFFLYLSFLFGRGELVSPLLLTFRDGGRDVDKNL